MTEVRFRYAKEDLLRAVAERKGVSLTTLMRSLDGELICCSFKPLKADIERVGGSEWLPTKNEEKPQPTGSYLKVGIYAGASQGDVPPPGVVVAYRFRFAS